MVITYFGGEFFKLQYGDTIVAYNPISKDSKLKSSRFGADIALVSLNHADFNGVENLEYGEKKPFVVSGPGEYEIKQIFIKGFGSKSNYGERERINTIYTLALDTMHLCFLGAINTEDIGTEANEAIEDIDILFVPIGGKGVLEASAAYKLAVKLEPKVIIPMHYGEMGQETALKTFLKEGGGEKTEAIDKFTVKKKDLEGKQGEIVILAANV